MDLIGIVVEAGRKKALALVTTAMATHVAANPPAPLLKHGFPHLSKNGS